MSKGLSRQAKRDLVAYSFIAPNFIGFAVFTLVPIVFAFALAFLNWDGSNPITFAGLSNFKQLGGDIFFRQRSRILLYIVSGLFRLLWLRPLRLQSY